MNLDFYKDAAVFLQKVEDFLLADEVTHNLPLGLLYRLINGNKGEVEVEPFLATVTNEEGHLQLVLIMTPPHHLIVSGKVGTLEAIPFAVDELINRGYSFPSVIGRADLSEAFAAHYSQKTDQSYSIEMSQRIYRLDRVIPPKKQDGHLRVVEEKDIQQVAKWILAFDQESVGGTLTKERALDRAKRGASQRDLFVWELEGDLVAMAGASRATSNGITVSLVYTPAEKRGKRFASNCVAALSQLLLDQGYTYCTLYTDLMNSTSNKIYQQIGYEPVNDSMVYRFN